jgi:DNA-binding NtrC family response regulator
LAGYTLHIPPLRERLDDVPILSENFLSQFLSRYQVPTLSLSPGAVQELCSHDWPGNVRELRVVIENAAVVCEGDTIGAAEIAGVLRGRQRVQSVSGEHRLPTSSGAAELHGLNGTSLPQLERELIFKAFEKHERNITRTAASLGIPRSTLRDKLRKYGAR